MTGKNRKKPGYLSTTKGRFKHMMFFKYDKYLANTYQDFPSMLDLWGINAIFSQIDTSRNGCIIKACQKWFLDMYIKFVIHSWYLQNFFSFHNSFDWSPKLTYDIPFFFSLVQQWSGPIWQFHGQKSNLLYYEGIKIDEKKN